MPSELREKLRKAIYSVDFGLAKWDGEKYRAMSAEDVNQIVDRIMAVLPPVVEKPVAILHNDPDMMTTSELICLYEILSRMQAIDSGRSHYVRAGHGRWVYLSKIERELFKRVDKYLDVAYSGDVVDNEEEVTG